MLNHRRILFLIVLLATLAYPTAAQNENTLVITSLSDLQSLDPHIGYDTVTWPILPLVYRGLVGMDADSNPTPEIAESWEISDDGMNYTFTLREGVMFSNGREVTAEDVKYSFTRLLDPDTASPTAYFFDMIEGADAVISGGSDELSGVTVIDDHTVEFQLSRPEWTTMKRFALPPGAIIAREQVESAENFGREPMGAGPFMLDSWEAGVRLTFSRNPNYWRTDSPHVDQVIVDVAVEPAVGVLRIDNGEADTMLDFVPNSDYPRISEDPALAERLVETAAFPNTQYIIPNVRQEPFSDVRVRQALSMAIDRERLIQLYNGRAVSAAGPIPPNVGGDNADLVPTAYDPDGARALLEEAGYADGFSTQIYSTTDPVDVTIMQAVIENWADVGVEAELVPIEFAQWLDVAFNRPEEMPVAYIGWFMDYLDPSNVIEALVACTGSFNVGGFCNEDLDTAFQAALLMPPGDERWSAFAVIEATIAEDVPNIYLLHVRNFYYTSERLQNLVADPAYLLDFEAVSVE
jgi:oligopeptide transport system substrate-binding protein